MAEINNNNDNKNKKKVNLCINGQSKVPPGFRFHPTEEELLHYYLRKKVYSQKIDLDVIREVDLNKLEPWDLQEECRIGSTPQNDWYFFSHKDKKYPTGTRTNRATLTGFWKATGRDKIICSCVRRIGLRKTLVFYKGRAPHGQKSDWIMHEYRLDDNSIIPSSNEIDVMTEDPMNYNEEGWVICRVFKKKNYQKIDDCPKITLSSSVDNLYTEEEEKTLPTFQSQNGTVLDHILLYMDRTGSSNICKPENQTLLTTNTQSQDDLLFKIPPMIDQTLISQNRFNSSPVQEKRTGGPAGITNWANLDRFVAWQLNSCHQRLCDRENFDEEEDNIDIWRHLTNDSSSSLDPFLHFSV